ncbi:unnamed protein product [Vitrella brassicaformis CCMP3155]|uniref:Uncharacterized protein n=2 Tax=Vitrella brassicaformis TaxID=1169539 RepID=A0A0G4EYR2_VITBC|nr:unnamed protein product [Vitrella brassicaformis CCMP3155]|eukprot:CEM04499.1 unnamed protein product [Vitrella brassicaformis CCMP3155]
MSTSSALADTARSVVVRTPSGSRRAFFRSKVHRDLVVLQCRNKLKERLLDRYLSVGHMECRVIRKRSFLPVLTKWAEVNVTNNPREPDTDPHIIPTPVLSSSELKRAVSDDVEVEWLMERLRLPQKEDCVRRHPYYPKIMDKPMPQFPYTPYQLEMLRDFYGLIKWPWSDWWPKAGKEKKPVPR